MFFVVIIQERFRTYTLQSLQGQLLGFHVLIAFLKVSLLTVFLKLSGKICSPKNETMRVQELNIKELRK